MNQHITISLAPLPGERSLRARMVFVPGIAFALLLFSWLVACAPSTAHPQSTETPQARALHTGRRISDTLHQLTGTHLEVGQTQHVVQELPDPAPPFVTSAGEVEIFGSAPWFIRYPDWETYERAGRFEIVPLDMQSPSGASIVGTYAHPWDLRKYRVVKGTRTIREFIVGGAMSPHGDALAPVWPVDNPNRRIFRFFPLGDHSWRREEKPIVGQVSTSWLGHSYGGNLFQPASPELDTIDVTTSSNVFFFFEKVDEDRGGTPYKTEIFLQTLPSPFASANDESIRIIGVGDPPFPSTRRSAFGYLVEGPRPATVEIHGKSFFIVGFSSGDFCTDGYAINYAWSTDVMGPYHAALTENGSDLRDLGRELKAKYGLSWMGRPAIYRAPNGTYEILFHAVDKKILPDNDYSKWPTGNPYELWHFFRSVFKARLDAKLGESGEPVLEIAL